LIHDLFIYKAPAGQQCRLTLAGKAVLQYLVDIMIEVMFTSENMNAKNIPELIVFRFDTTYYKNTVL